MRRESECAAGGEFVQVFGIVPDRHIADSVQNKRRQYRTEQRREQHEREAEREIAIRILRPSRRSARNRHGCDKREFNQDLLNLMGIVPKQRACRLSLR